MNIQTKLSAVVAFLIAAVAIATPLTAAFGLTFDWGPVVSSLRGFEGKMMAWIGAMTTAVTLFLPQLNKLLSVLKGDAPSTDEAKP